jgi:hypothetical protein
MVMTFGNTYQITEQHVICYLAVGKLKYQSGLINHFRKWRDVLAHQQVM